MPRTDTLSAPEKQIVKLKMRGLKQREIAKIVYPHHASLTSAETMVSKVLDRPIVSKTIQEACNRAGLTYDRITGKISQGFEAQKAVINRDGEIVGQVPDHGAQLGYVTLAAKITGMERVNVDVPVDGLLGQALAAALEHKRRELPGE